VGFTADDYLTILSLPENGQLYMAAVEDIRATKREDGSEPTVEEVLFTREHFLGSAPLTVKAPPGEYILAIRSPARYLGFDGDCIRKTTTDVITGGKRHCYHLYPIRKKALEYQCFVASFIPPDTAQDSAVNELARRGTFTFPLEPLKQLITETTGVPEEDRDAVAERLNQLGVAFYGSEGSRYLVKLSILGDRPFLKEWMVTE
jgi:hypothetical protein